MSETKEALNNAIIEMIKMSVDGMKDGVSFLKSEIPEVVEQLLLWYGVHSFIIWFVFGVLFIIIGIICVVKMVKYINIANENKDELYACFATIAVIASLITITIGILNLLNLTWLKILIAPKVWLIEYGKTLIS